ncbi:MAG: GatB/YqeY domain-containing protein [Myxococcaceae bacterium]|nr:GatB/YqeY domain-containing protein [Myxococcaceae bacterium]MCI0672862.1 GatB/YqeY domain-containing protein [Myxococcaceae bacterium]
MPTLKERIDADLKDAMRAKAELTLGVLRMLKSAIKYKEVEPGASALDDAGITKVIGTEIKKRRDSVDQYKQAGREDLAAKEEQEIVVLQGYLPQQLSAEDLRAEVTRAIQEAQAKGPKDMGAVMKTLQPRVAGRAEGKAVSEEVKAQLAQLGG